MENILSDISISSKSPKKSIFSIVKSKSPSIGMASFIKICPTTVPEIEFSSRDERLPPWAVKVKTSSLEELFILIIAIFSTKSLSFSILHFIKW